MQAASNRTFICCVVFLDIVEYSKKPVAEQIQLKERLNALLTEALANVAVNDRIILDTGDGAALSFLGDPEDALFVSLSLRDALAGPQPPGPPMRMRIGINLGPVKLVRDINGQPNIIGDGINVAQRVMGFSEPGQILVSRSYYEVVSRLSSEFGKLFHYEGSRTDKHVREHEVYAVQASGAALQQAVAAAAPRKKDVTQSGPVVLERLSHSASFVAERLRRNPPLGTALAVVAILAVAVGLRMGRQPPPAPVASPPPPAKVAAAPAPAPAREAATPSPAKKPAAAPAKRAAEPVKKVPGAPAASAAKPAVPASPPARTRPEDKLPAPTGSGTLLFTIRPWGEIYVDGRREGDVPPLYELRVSAGRHRIEIRHPEYPPYVQTVEIRPGSRVEIKHWFVGEKRPFPSVPLPWK